MSRRLTKEEFIERSNIIHHNKYDYSLVDYKNCETKVKIICPIHGTFEQIPWNHMMGRNCPKCKKSNGEKNIEYYLNNNNIIFEEQKTFQSLIDKAYLSYDFYIPNKKILIEYNGIQHYKFNKFFYNTYKQFLIQKHHDWLKRKYARDNNIKLLAIPYWEFDNIEIILKENL